MKNSEKLQRVQNAVVCVALPSQLPTTTLLSKLHGLPINSRITIKLACFTHKLLANGQYSYLHAFHDHHTHHLLVYGS